MRTTITLTAIVLTFLSLTPLPACCPAYPSGKPVVNADQTVIILWDAATKTQHFIRRASFKSDAADFGFLIPTPAQPDLQESGNDSFPYLQKITEPEIVTRKAPTGGGCACSSQERSVAVGKANDVTVLEEKQVAGFDAKVLAATSAETLVQWLNERGYQFSPEVAAWAKPYVEQGWKITALKVSKDPEAKERQAVAASALRLTFKTDRPLFPYREPDPKDAAKALGASRRLLRIYFIGEARYAGDLTKEVPWTGKVAWANKLPAEARRETLKLLGLPAETGPAEWWLTEFEDNWPYRVAPADVYFTRHDDQQTVKRPPIVRYVQAPLPSDGAFYVLAAAVVLPPVVRRWRWWKLLQRP